MTKRFIILVVCLSASTAPAVGPAVWKQTTEQDFAAGELKGVAAGSLGTISLGRRMEILVTSDKAPAAVARLAASGKTLYAAAGNASAVYTITDQKIAKLAEPPGTVVGCLMQDGKDLIVGTCGKGAGLYRIDAAGKVTPIWSDKDVEHVWAVVTGPKGVLYAATGPAGKVYAVEAAGGKAKEIYAAGELAKNILCLAKSEKGLLYAGTDTEGLVVEIDPASGAARVLLDATEKEISVIIPVAGGGLYVATSDAEKLGGAPPPGVPESQPGIPRPGPSAGNPPHGPEGFQAAEGAATPQPTTLPAAGPPPVMPPGMVIEMPMPGHPLTLPGVPGQPTEQREGNAVYYITPAGIVETVFRRPVLILDMLKSGDRLILATGNEGVVYSVATDGREVVQVVDTDAKQVTALAAGDGGRLFFATSNLGSVGVVEPELARQGTFTSIAMEAPQIARIGTFRAAADVPTGAKITFATRAGNVAKPGDKTWSAWSKETPVTGGFQKVESPAGRFFQYRLTLTAAGEKSPVVRDVEAVYQIGNLAPVIAAVTAEPTGFVAEDGRELPGGTKCYRHILVTASDPNEDALAYTIHFRQAGMENWIAIADAIPVPRFLWDTRTVQDGAYELRVTVSDSPSNPPGSARSAAQVADRVIVDNTPPVFKNLAAEAAKGGAAKVTGAVEDAGSRIVSILYSVDSNDKWNVVLPDDGICDSSAEKFTIQLEKLTAGEHRVAVRADDAFGNVSYSAVTVTAK